MYIRKFVIDFRRYYPALLEELEEIGLLEVDD